MTRDMTDAQFRKSLARNGFTRTSYWVSHKDFPGHGISLIYNSRTMKLMRRKSIAHALRRLQEIRTEARREA